MRPLTPIEIQVRSQTEKCLWGFAWRQSYKEKLKKELICTILRKQTNKQKKNNGGEWKRTYGRRKDSQMGFNGSSVQMVLYFLLQKILYDVFVLCDAHKYCGWSMLSENITKMPPSSPLNCWVYQHSKYSFPCMHGSEWAACRETMEYEHSQKPDTATRVTKT